MATELSHPSLAPASPQGERARWMAQLSQADPDHLEAAWRQLAAPPAHSWLRPVETGLVMLRGRAGGTGQPFNLGEMTVTRAAVMLEPPHNRVGFGYVTGRARRHAELAALFDALLQDEALRQGMLAGLLSELAETDQKRRRRRAADVAATRVDFTTMVRGDD
ncbi:protein phnG [Hypericibacter adhaerens]|uniref:Protein phnG n=2 Tax=Hypericibacter adhaerens TaxID=2602016 RepID=A0A5J6MWX9_9PROT|nr:phosphonate C-P lyase system protein PhnG [Hypericibacter adhaerens]QEX22009.1 protein phnG [Hypericibacter adhaerens]